MTESISEILKVQKKKSKQLEEESAQDSFENSEESRLQCMRCSGDENDCGAVMPIRTRSKGMAEQGDGSDGKGLS